MPQEITISTPKGAFSREASRRLTCSSISECMYDDFVLVSITANATHMSFYIDSSLLHTAALPRMITDCAHKDGLLVGGAGLYLSKLKFYTGLLSSGQVCHFVVLEGSRRDSVCDLLHGRTHVARFGLLRGLHTHLSTLYADCWIDDMYVQLT